MKPVILKDSNEKFYANKLICIGQNYAEHAKEINFDIPSSPIFFLKPASAIIYDGDKIVIPSISKNVHHEVELVVLIGKEGKKIPHDKAMEYVAGYGVGLDMTMRDIQLEAKKKGFPWTLAKGFDTAAPISEFVQKNRIPDVSSLYIRLMVNDEERQYSCVDKLIFPVEFLISYISKFMTLEKGDMIFTGTPQGVATVKDGDKLKASLLDCNGNILSSLTVEVCRENQ